MKLKRKKKIKSKDSFSYKNWPLQKWPWLLKLKKNKIFQKLKKNIVINGNVNLKSLTITSIIVSLIFWFILFASILFIGFLIKEFFAQLLSRLFFIFFMLIENFHIFMIPILILIIFRFRKKINFFGTIFIREILRIFFSKTKIKKLKKILNNSILTKIFKIVKYDRIFHLFIFLIILLRIFLVDLQPKISTVNLEYKDEVAGLADDISKSIGENTVVDKKTPKIILKDSDPAKYKFLYHPTNNKINSWEKFKQSSSNYNFWVEVRNYEQEHWSFSWAGRDTFDQALKTAFDSCNELLKKGSVFKKNDFCVPYFINYNDVVRKTTRIEKITYLEKYYESKDLMDLLKKNPLALVGY